MSLRPKKSRMGKWPQSCLISVFDIVWAIIPSVGNAGNTKNMSVCFCACVLGGGGGGYAGELGKHRLCLFALRKWNLLTAVVSSFQNECVLIFLVLCDSPLAADRSRGVLWFTRTPHSLLCLQINHWNTGTFPDQFGGTVLFLTRDLSGYTASSPFTHAALGPMVMLRAHDIGMAVC